MIASRGMGAISKSKMPKAKKIVRKDHPQDVTMYGQGGNVGLYENIHRKRERIASGSGEKMRKPGTEGAPTAAAFLQSAKTAKRQA